MAFDWLIIGGGIHGVHLAARLLGDGGVARDRLRIVDPADRLLDRWRTCTATTGMSHLRSTVVHHLDLDPFSLRRFGRKKERRTRGLFAAPYDRPSLALFNAHCEQVVERYGLTALHVRRRASACGLDRDGAVLRLTDGTSLRTRNVLFAVGSGDKPRWPVWAPQGHPQVHHVFDPQFDGWPARGIETVAVVGGGISAGQVALRLLREGHEVHLICRHALREHQFDSEPGWLGPRYMSRFEREPDLSARRTMIDNARHGGSMPPRVRRALRRAIEQRQIGWHLASVDDLDDDASRDRRLELRLSTGSRLSVDRVHLATGFESARPGGAMLDELISTASLPCSTCGYPVVDRGLRWHPRVRVSGALAELELGPSARNIAGARRAGDRLVSTLRSRPRLRTTQLSEAS